MTEQKQLVILLVSVAIIGAVGLLLIQSTIITATAGDVYVDNYKADLYPNGILSEKFEYAVKVSDQYRMLYRNWQAPLVYQGNTINGNKSNNNNDNSAVKNNSHIELVSLTVPAGTVPYIKDHNRVVKVFSNSNPLYTEGTIIASSPSSSSTYDGEISSLANLNEVGAYKPDRYAAGTYETNAIYQIFPPLECDKQYCHLNLMLASEHLPYSKVNIVIHDPQNLISQIFVHSNTLSVSKIETKDNQQSSVKAVTTAIDAASTADNSNISDTKWTITGTSPKDSLLEIEILANPAISHVMKTAFTKEVPFNVKDKTISTNTLFILFPVWDQALKAIIILFPIILLLVYYKVGKEKSFTVPKFLSYVPKERKPWLVNLVFKKSTFHFDKDGFHATILDLHRRGIIEIESIGGGEGIGDANYDDGSASKLNMAKDLSLRIKLLNKEDTLGDIYEKDMLDFLESNSEGGIFDTFKFKSKIEDLQSQANAGDREAGFTLSKIRNDIDSLTRNFRNKGTTNQFMSSGKKYSWIIFACCLVVTIASLTLFPGVYTSLILLFQSVPLLFVSPMLFGRWKGDYYKEKLEWDAFSTFLSDFVSIKKYAPQDIKIWQQWLVYATALGIADNVVKALKELDIKIPQVYVDTFMYSPYYFNQIYWLTYYSTNTGNTSSMGSSWSSSSSGGGATGGGFGSGGGFGGGGAGAR